tara:strand:+ start:100 stop:282 length:183 start_codon:yes stop_codon:yes gene_type:complete
MPEYEVHTGSHKFNITSTKWWVKWWVKHITGAKMVGRDNFVRELVTSNYRAKILIYFYLK